MSESVTVKLDPKTLEKIDKLARDASEKSGIGVKVGRATTIRKLVERQLESEEDPT